MKIGAIVQARMSSSRFPGKVVYPVMGKPMLQYLLESLQHCRTIDAVVVATSAERSDNPLAEFCWTYGIPCFRGSLQDVAQRFVGVLEQYQFDAFVRVSGDSPLLDHRIVESAAGMYREGRFDLVTNVFERTFPKGQSVEAMSAEVFQRAYPLMRTDADREHVTPYFYTHAADFVIHNFESGGDYSRLQMSVDSPADMKHFEAVVSAFSRPHWEYTFEELLPLFGQVGHQA
jgi:spore coat polysaccharide biosynthesis protein SpsF